VTPPLSGIITRHEWAQLQLFSKLLPPCFSLVNTATINVLTPIKQIKTLSGKRKQYRIKKPTIHMKLSRQLMNS
jgi:hypothetical protein